jgi:predicted enzyme related to lactoylglutathione lyase
MSNNNKIDFIELPVGSPEEVAAGKEFFGSVFGWSFRDWGDDYVDTEDSGVPSGFNADPGHKPAKPLPVVHVADVEAARQKVVAAGGKVTKQVFSFPGGKRFHFTDPAGNEWAAWSEQKSS